MGEGEEAVTGPARVSAVRRTRLVHGASDESCERITRLAARLAGAPIALTTLLDDQHEHVVSAISGGHPVALREIPLAEALSRRVVETGRPVIVADARIDAAFAGNSTVDSLGIVGWLGVPLYLGDCGVLGVLGVGDPCVRSWEPATIALIEELAALLVVCIEARMASFAWRDQGSLLAHVIEQVSDAVVVVDSEGAPFAFNGPGEETLLSQTPTGPGRGPGLFRGEDRVPVEAGDFPLDRAVRTAATVQEQVFVRTSRESDARRHRVIAAPVWDEDGTPLGAFCVMSILPDGKDRRSDSPAGRAHGNAQGREAPVLDRRSFAAAALERMVVCRRAGEGLLLYVVRIDGLDRIRERFGGLQSTSIVDDIGEVVRRCFGEDELVGLVGPDALAVLVRDVRQGEAARVLGRIQLGVAELNSSSPRPFTLTVRVGVAAWDPSVAVGLDQLMLRADLSARDRGRAAEATA